MSIRAIRTIRALVLAGISAAPLGCIVSNNGGCPVNGSACAVGDPTPTNAPCCDCNPTVVPDGGFDPEAGPPTGTAGVWQGRCGGPLDPPSLEV